MTLGCLSVVPPGVYRKMLRLLAVVCALITAACVGPQQSESFAQVTTPQEQTRIRNQPIFDVAICQQRQLILPNPLSPGILVAAIFSARPQVKECLVDPKNRGPAATTRIMVETTVTDQVAVHTIDGDNLTAEGRKCIGDAVNALVPLHPLAKGARPVESQTEFFHELNKSPAVIWGGTEDSDFSGVIRLAQGAWCHCYAPFTTQAPPVLKAKLKLTRAWATPAAVAFEPSGSPQGDMLATCLKETMDALPVRLSSDEVTFLHRFYHFHSLATEPAASLPPEVRYRQLELARGQYAAEAALAFAAHANSEEAYNAIATQYNEDAVKDYRLLPSLYKKCAELLRTADAWVAAIEAQQKIDQQTLVLIRELKTADTGWARLEAANRLELTNTLTELTRAKKSRQRDEHACPKEHK
jgi:hypothetical protein